MKKIGITTSGTVIVEMTLAQFEAIGQLQSPLGSASAIPQVAVNPAAQLDAKKMKPADLVTYVRERIIKLKPKRKDRLVHAITSMFHLTGGIDEREVEKVIVNLQKEKFLAIDADGRVTYRTA